MSTVVDRSQTGIPGNPYSYEGEPIYRRASRPKQPGTTQTVRTWQPDDQEIITLPTRSVRNQPKAAGTTLRTATGRTWVGDELPASPEETRASRVWNTQRTPVRADVADEEMGGEEGEASVLQSISRSAPEAQTDEYEEEAADQSADYAEEEVFDQQSPEGEEIPSRMIDAPEPITYTARRRARNTTAPQQEASRGGPVARQSSVGYPDSHKLQAGTVRRAPRSRGLYVMIGVSIVLFVLLAVANIFPVTLSLFGGAFLLMLALLVFLLRNWRSQRYHPLLYIGTCMLLLCTAYLFALQGLVWGFDLSSDARYGTPRTFQLDAVVGHHDSPEHQTHFIVLNLHGQIEIIEIPGGDPSHERVYVGPLLKGAGAAKEVVTVQIQNGQKAGKPNLLVRVTGEPDSLFDIPSKTYLLLNAGDNFNPKPVQKTA
ncbi:MAG TPA: hypothetical protein VFA10_20145 [Ktedonobacteraceae bacterium]|nr:hypothetical protein [Ktedonobacteraceae bacterium]